MQSSWSWSSSSRCSQMGTTQTKVVQTTIKNGQVVTTTTINGLSPTISSQSSLGFNRNTHFQVEQLQNYTPTISSQTSLGLNRNKHFQVKQPQYSMASEPEPEAAPSTPAPVNAKQFEQECLDEHNRYRALHGCPPLKLSPTLCSYANDWANDIASRKVMEHRKNNKYGENIFMANGQVVDGKMTVKSWYDEIGQYNFGKPGFGSGTGHFTQVIWKASKELGIGIQQRGQSTWVVANYDPAGNVMGQFPQNVPKKV